MNLLLAIGISLMSAAESGGVDVSVMLRPPVIPFHKQAGFRIVVEAPADANVQLTDMTPKFGGLLVHGTPTRTTEKAPGGRQRIVQTYTIEPIFIGDYPIEPVEAAWGEGQKVVVSSPALRVRDLTPEEKEIAERFAPNAGPIPVEKPWLRRWTFWGGVGLVGAASLGCAGYYVVSRRKRTVETPPPPPWEVAYARLRELDERHLPQAGKIGPYYVDLSAILRYYIEDRFHLRAPERTTPEFLEEAVRNNEFSEGRRRLVAGVLKHCDRVKFAQHEPTLHEMERSFAEVLRFIDETVPQPEATDEEAAA